MEPQEPPPPKSATDEKRRKVTNFLIVIDHMLKVFNSSCAIPVALAAEYFSVCIHSVPIMIHCLRPSSRAGFSDRLHMRIGTYDGIGCAHEYGDNGRGREGRFREGRFSEMADRVWAIFIVFCGCGFLCVSANDSDHDQDKKNPFHLKLWINQML